MAYVDEYKGFVPIVSGFRPSTKNTNTASTYAPVSTGFVPVVGGFPRTQYRAPTPEYDFSSFDGESYTSPSPSPHDFSAFVGPPSTSTPEQQQTTATTSSSVISDLDSYAHDDPPSDLDEIGFTDEELSGPDFTGTGLSAGDTFAEAFGFTSGNPTGYALSPQDIQDVVGQGLKGEVIDTFSSPQNFATTVAKSVGTNMLTSFGQAALGKIGLGAVPLGPIIAIAQGLYGGFSTQNTLQAIVDQEANIWGLPPDKQIGFWNSLGVYLGFTDVHTLLSEEEFDTGLMMSGEYSAKGGLFGEPHRAGMPNVLNEKQIEQMIAKAQKNVEMQEEQDAQDAEDADVAGMNEPAGPLDDIEPGTFGSFYGTPEVPTIQDAINQARANVTDSDPGGGTGVGVGSTSTAEDVGADTAPSPGGPAGGIGSEPSGGDDADGGDGGGGGGGDDGDPGGGGPCWVAGTQILMEDGSCKNIENLKIGDMVMSFPENSKIRRWNTSLEAKPIINLLVSKADIWHLNDSMVSENEWMVKSDGTASLVQWLNVGDELMDQDGNKIKVYRNEPAEGKLSRQVVYNFESENNYSYIANNMRTLKGKAVRMAESKMNSFGEGYFSDESNNMKQGWSMQDEYKRKFGS